MNKSILFSFVLFSFLGISQIQGKKTTKQQLSPISHKGQSAAVDFAEEVQGSQVHHNDNNLPNPHSSLNNPEENTEEDLYNSHNDSLISLPIIFQNPEVPEIANEGNLPGLKVSPIFDNVDNEKSVKSKDKNNISSEKEENKDILNQKQEYPAEQQFLSMDFDDSINGEEVNNREHSDISEGYEPEDAIDIAFNNLAETVGIKIFYNNEKSLYENLEKMRRLYFKKQYPNKDYPNGGIKRSALKGIEPGSIMDVDGKKNEIIFGELRSILNLKPFHYDHVKTMGRNLNILNKKYTEKETEKLGDYFNNRILEIKFIENFGEQWTANEKRKYSLSPEDLPSLMELPSLIFGNSQILPDLDLIKNTSFSVPLEQSPSQE